MNLRPIYVFIDEGGNLDFTPKGTKYLTLTAILTLYPSEKVEALNELKHALLSKQLLPSLNPIYLEEKIAQRFHATEDIQKVRDEVFNIITQMQYFKAHSIVIQKNKAHPSIRSAENIYPKIISSLVKYIFKKYLFSELVIIIDGIPVLNHRNAFLKAIKQAIHSLSNPKPYSVFCPPSNSNYFLQVADYVNWAIFKKWESGNTKSYDLIKGYLDVPELDMYSKGKTEFYKFK